MPRERVSDRVVVVVIDERALSSFGQWPWPRTRVAELVSRIAAGKPLAIGVDILFPEPDRFSPAFIARQVEASAPELAASLRKLPSNDVVLGRALATVPSVLAVAGLDIDDPRYAGPPGGPPFRFVQGAGDGIRQWRGHLRNVAEVDAGAASHGLVSTDFEAGVARSVAVVAKIGVHGVAGLGVELVRLAVGSAMELRPAAGGLIEVRFGDYAVPAQADGRAYIRYGRSDPDRFVLSSDILSGKFDVRGLEDKLVLLGFTGLGLQDLSVTPLGESVHSVENHAQVAEAILEGQFLRRVSYAPLIEAALLAVIGLLLVAVIPRSNAQRSFLWLAMGVIALLGAGAVAFRLGGLLFDPVAPSLGAILVFGVLQVGLLSEAQRQRRQLREQAARMAGELHAAQRIQMGLLPNPREVFDAEPRVEVAALLEPARTVGGDFYDCFMLDDRRLFFLVADVSGKGLPASLFMASVKSILKSAALSARGSVGEMLASAQEEIRHENPESLFVTVLAAVLDLESGELDYANAGHEPVWSHRPRERAQRLEGSGGPPLCVLDEFLYPTCRRTMRTGEWLLVLSDGATEAMNPSGAFFGAERLRTTLGWLGDESTARDIVARVRDDVRRFSAGAEPADDLTLLAIRWVGPRGAGVNQSPARSSA